MAAIGIDMSDRDPVTVPNFGEIIKVKTDLEIEYTWACQERDELWHRFNEMVDSWNACGNIEAKEAFYERCAEADKWVDALYDRMMSCYHLRTESQGSIRLVAGDVYDDIVEVCDDCGRGF